MLIVKKCCEKAGHGEEGKGQWLRRGGEGPVAEPAQCRESRGEFNPGSHSELQERARTRCAKVLIISILPSACLLPSLLDMKKCLLAAFDGSGLGLGLEMCNSEQCREGHRPSHTTPNPPASSLDP